MRKYLGDLKNPIQWPKSFYFNNVKSGRQAAKNSVLVEILQYVTLL
jgi:hypothetical protein